MYRTICTELWTDEKFIDLPLDHVALFVYLFTNRHTHVTGLYYLPKSFIAEETKLSLKTISSALGIFENRRLAYYDDKAKVVFVRTMMSHQGKGQHVRRAAVKHLPTMRDSFLIGKFLECYPEIPYTYTPQSQPVIEHVVQVQINGNSLIPTIDCTLDADSILNFLNEKTGRKFRSREANGKPSAGLEFIIARLKSGVDVQTCKTLIMRKVRDWRDDPKMMKYLRPETLFNRTKFESYLAEVST